MKKIFVLLLMGLIGGGLRAQSYHFSQFFSTPLLTNPAHTGLVDGPSRLASNFRSQGAPGGNTFFTGYLSADVRLLRKQLTAGQRAGAGIYLMNDRSLTGALQTNSAGVSVAYHVPVGDGGRQSLGLGMQAVYHQRRIDYDKLTFENQYGPNGFDPSLSPGETFNVARRSFFDLNTGVLYNANLGNRSFFAGVAMYNVLRRKENLLTEEWRMPVRYTLQGGAQFVVNGQDRVYTSLTAMLQARANETTVGGAYGLALEDGKKGELRGGLWYRVNDAVIPYMGFVAKGFQAGLSYDHTVSGLRNAGRIRNAFELTLLYAARSSNQPLKVLVPWF